MKVKHLLRYYLTDFVHAYIGNDKIYRDRIRKKGKNKNIRIQDNGVVVVVKIFDKKKKQKKRNVFFCSKTILMFRNISFYK